jgi:hypothetical protein
MSSNSWVVLCITSGWTAEETLPPTALLLLAYNSVDRQRHGKHVPAAINAYATTEEPLDTSALYQRKVHK